jgi:hypothetical protein
MKYTVVLYDTYGSREDWKETDSLSTAKSYLKQANDFLTVSRVEIEDFDGKVIIGYDLYVK